MFSEENQKSNNKWIPYFLAAVIFGAGVGFGVSSNLQFPTEPTLVSAETEIDWQTEAVEAWSLVVLLPGALEDDRRNCESVQSVRQCAWMMERMEFGIRVIIQERIPEELRDVLLPQLRSPS